jgi:hypothetical protein
MSVYSDVKYIFIDLDTLLFSYRNRNIPYYRLPRETFMTKEQKQKSISNEQLNELGKILNKLSLCDKKLFIITNVEYDKVKSILKMFKLDRFFTENYFLGSNLPKNVIDYYNLPSTYKKNDITIDWTDVKLRFIRSIIQKQEKLENDKLQKKGKPKNYKILGKNIIVLDKENTTVQKIKNNGFFTKKVNNIIPQESLLPILKLVESSCSYVLLLVDFFNNINDKHNFISDSTVKSYFYLKDSKEHIRKQIENIIKQLKENKERKVEINKSNMPNKKTITKFILDNVNWDGIMKEYKTMSEVETKITHIDIPNFNQSSIKKIIVIDVGLKFSNSEDTSFSSKISSNCSYHKKSLVKNWKKLTQRAGKRNKNKTYKR